jgi:flagellar motility protein MotE (MotC chaperone)
MMLASAAATRWTQAGGRVVAACLPALCIMAACALPASAQSWEPVVVAVDPDALTPAVGRRQMPMQRPKSMRSQPSPAIEAFMAPPAKLAERQQKPTAVEPSTPAGKPSQGPSLQTSTARRYCVSIANVAADARYAWQKKQLADIAEELEKRVAVLESKTVEFQKWVKRRDEFVEKAQQSLVLIYARMRPDAAALQLTAMDEETASAVLLKLDPRIASKILNDMEPARAARLTAIIGGAAQGSPVGGQPGGPQEKKS